MKQRRAASEAAILADVIQPRRGNLSPEAAQSFLEFKFSPSASLRIRTLLKRNNFGTLTEIERIQLEKYLRVGQLIDLLHAKARLSLKKELGRNPDEKSTG